MGNIVDWIKRQKEKKGKSEDEKIRLNRYYRREDAVRKALKKQKKDREHQEYMAKLKQQAEEEEQLERLEHAQYGRRALRQRPLRITKKMPRLR